MTLLPAQAVKASRGQTAETAAQESTRLLREPDISRTSIVFVYGGDLWLVPRTGGAARRLTANPSIKSYPKFSPDGRWIAFTGNYDGNTDVYVIPADGGEPKRLTYHPAGGMVLGWTPDSRSVLFRSSRASYTTRFTQLFTVPVTGGLETELPLPEAGLASLSPDGTQVAYNRIAREFRTWKRYRGGMQAYVSVYDMAHNRYWEVPHGDETDFYPMWHGDKIYFASDRTGTVNLFCYDIPRKTTRQLTHFDEYDVKWPSLGSDAIVFEEAGVLQTLDLATDKVTPLSVLAHSDLTATRPELRHVESEVASATISPSGTRALIEAHGDLFTVPAKKGDSRDITNTPGVREVLSAWSPDGKYVAYFSDRTGEYELCMRPQDGTGTETQLTSGCTDSETRLAAFGNFNGGGFNTLVWSPDSKALLFTDMAYRLWMVTLADKKPVLVDSDNVVPTIPGAWSPDSKWIAYVRLLPNFRSCVMLYSLDQKKPFAVTDGRFTDHRPVFDPGGKYLYFASERTFTPSPHAPETNIEFDNQTGLYALVLRADTPSPLAPESDEEKPKDESAKKDDAAKPDDGKSGKGPAPVRIDLDGLQNRIVPLPVPPGNYDSLAAGAGKLFYLADSRVLHVFDLAARDDKVIIAGIQSYDINPAATKILYTAVGPAGPTVGIIDPTPGQPPGAGKINLSLEMRTDPRAEWKEVYWEAWRFERDFYYDPAIKGLPWKTFGERYARLLPSVAHRDDLTYLLSELIGELNTSHAYVFPSGLFGGGAAPTRIGLLGVDFEPDQGYYRFRKIYEGENWDPARRAPLTEPGVKAKAGNYLIAVNGVPLRTDTNPYAPFEGTVGKTITLTINAKPSETGAWEVKVRPIADETSLRYVDWVEGNQRKVEQATGGRIGYFHVPNTADEGMTEFSKGFYSQLDKDGVIVDERFNSGGNIPTFFTERLGRKLLNMYTPRYGIDIRIPNEAIYGPKALLINEWAGSGGDIFPYYFRKSGIGPLIGKRTWGGITGIDFVFPFMDGSAVSAPNFRGWQPEDNRWFGENHGIDPDIEVSNTPDLMNQGHDPQLERAIAYIQDQLKKNPPPTRKHPPFPTEPVALPKR